MLHILYSDRPERWAQFEGPLRRAFDAASLGPYRLETELPPEVVDYIVYAPGSKVEDFKKYTKLKVVLSLWAGVEQIVGNQTLTVPLTRMSDTGLREGMVEWVTGHVLRHHLGMDRHILGQDGIWREFQTPPLARDRTVAILGLGALGQACAEALASLNFNVLGWSRTEKKIDGIVCFSGAKNLKNILAKSEIVVLLLPDTPATENIIDHAALDALPQGAVLINPGRGPLIDDDALLAALDNGHLGHATLDVFRTEPLPPEHPFWAHPKITVTPHIAAETRAHSAADLIAENIRRSEAGEDLLYLVDRKLSY